MLDFLLPQRCVACTTSGAHLCAVCIGALNRLTAPLCDRCGAPTVWPVERCHECNGRRLAFAHARAAVAYDEVARRLVAAWKERGVRGLARVAGAVVVDTVDLQNAGCVTFVPPDRDRQLKRGVHPAQALAHELATRFELPLETLLARARPSTRQRGLGESARRRNLAGAIETRDRIWPSVVLVDDVYTTGATAHAAASALRRGGVRRVEVVTFARTLRVR